MPPRRGPDAFPDQQVWPPASQSEPVGGATQPLPVVPGGPGNPFAAPGGPANPPSAPGGTAHPSAAPGGGAPPTVPSPAFTPPQPPEAPSPAAEEPTPRKPRTLLLGVSALVAFVLALGIPTGDHYLFFKSGQPDDIVHEVPKGQEKAFEHVSWKTSIEPMVPAPSNTTPDKQWLKITITRKALDDTGKVLTAKPELFLRDKQERTWQVEVMEDNTPVGEDGVVGKPYSFTAGAVVPKTVAGEVELHLRPNTTYRSDTPTDKLLEIKPEEEEKAKHKDVLVFKR